jgi:hypothetical protein
VSDIARGNGIVIVLETRTISALGKRNAVARKYLRVDFQTERGAAGVQYDLNRLPGWCTAVGRDLERTVGDGRPAESFRKPHARAYVSPENRKTIVHIMPTNVCVDRGQINSIKGGGKG